MCILNIVSWGSCLTVWYHIMNSWRYIFLPLIFRRVCRTVWIIWIDWICWVMWIVWSNWSFTMFQGNYEFLINWLILVISSSYCESITYKNVTTIFIVLNLSCSWIVNGFTWFTRNLIIFKCCTSILVYVLDNSFLVCLTVDNWCVSTWIFRSDWFSWSYWLTWFRWILWIWQVWFVTWYIWNNWLTWFGWIIWIIWILHSWCWWEVWIIRFRNQAAKRSVSNSFFKIFLSNCLRRNTSFISVVTCQSWCWNCTIVSLISYPWFIRVKNCTCHLIKF